MLRMVRRVLGANDADLEDVFQEALLAVIRALPGFRGDCSTRHFGCRIATLTALKARRGRYGQVELVAPVDDTGTTTPFVEPNRQAPPIAPVSVVEATEQVFAWAIQCLGLGETSCTSELRRLSLATGAVDVVASADAALPFAVSPDGTKIVFAYREGIYLKTF